MISQFAELLVFGLAPLIVGLMAIPDSAAADRDSRHGPPSEICRNAGKICSAGLRADQPTISVSENQ